MYKKFFGLRESPFNVNPDPRYLFLTPQTRKALDEIAYGIQARKGLILLTGEVGTGKTTLLNSLLDHLHRQHTPTAFIFNSHLGVNDLFDFMLADFQVPSDSKAKGGALLRLNSWLVERYRAGEAPVLIVDEAQGLPVHALEEIRMLLNLETPERKLLQIVLAGQPELEERLERPDLRQLKQRITIRCKTSALTLAETHDYIQSRLKIASGGGGGRKIFASDAVDALHYYSNGIPRVANLLAEHALISAYVDGLPQVPAHIILGIAREFQYEGPKRIALPTLGAESAGASLDVEHSTPEDATVRVRAAAVGSAREREGGASTSSVAAQLVAAGNMTSDLRQTAAPILNSTAPAVAKLSEEALISPEIAASPAFAREAGARGLRQTESLSTFSSGVSDADLQLAADAQEGHGQRAFSSGLHVVEAQAKVDASPDSRPRQVGWPRKTASAPAIGRPSRFAFLRSARRALVDGCFWIARVWSGWRNRLLAGASPQTWEQMTAPALRESSQLLRSVRSLYQRSLSRGKSWVAAARREWPGTTASAFRWLCEPWNPGRRRFGSSQVFGVRRSLSHRKI